MAELYLRVRELTRSSDDAEQVPLPKERGCRRHRNSSQGRREQSPSTNRSAVRSVEVKSPATSGQTNNKTVLSDNQTADIKRELDHLRKEMADLKRENATLRQRSTSSASRQQQQMLVKQPVGRISSQIRPPPYGTCFNCGSPDHWRSACAAPV